MTAAPPPAPQPRASAWSRWRRRVVLALMVPVIALASWIQWGKWAEQPPHEIPWQPDAIVVLGGAAATRWEHTLTLHQQFPETPIIVSGDGGKIYSWLHGRGVPPALLIHETEANSTYQNAQFTEPLLAERHAKRVVLVTDWFHAPRAMAVFRALQPQREFVCSFTPRSAAPNDWEIECARRERFVALIYFFWYRINSFAP